MVSKVLSVVRCSVINELQRIWSEVGLLPASHTEAAVLIHAHVGGVRQPVLSLHAALIHLTAKVREHLHRERPIQRIIHYSFKDKWSEQDALDIRICICTCVVLWYTHGLCNSSVLTGC